MAIAGLFLRTVLLSSHGIVTPEKGGILSA